MNASLFILHARPFFLGESFPFAFLLLANERRPGFLLPVERKFVRQSALLRIETKFDCCQVIVHLAAAVFGVASAKNIQPMTDVSFIGIVETDEDYRRSEERRVGKECR